MKEIEMAYRKGKPFRTVRRQSRVGFILDCGGNVM
jgi:hypothetical protein